MRRKLSAAALSAGGLGYSDIPKGLVKFHRYGDGRADAFEEHINAARLYSDGVHFTVSPRFPQDEKRRLEAGGDVSFSVQDPATDPVALWEDGDLVTDDSGEIVFPPFGARGASGQSEQSESGCDFYFKHRQCVAPRPRAGAGGAQKGTCGASG